MTDQEILALLETKQEGAFDALYQAYHQRLTGTAIHFLGREDPEIEDVIQETFAVALKKLPRTKIQTNLYGWLNRACALNCFDRLRARKRSLSSEEKDLELAAGALSRDKARHAEQDSDQDERLELLRKAIGELDPACRDLVRLRDLDGLSYAELGKRLRLPMGTVMSRLARCREVLKKKMLKRTR